MGWLGDAWDAVSDTASSIFGGSSGGSSFAASDWISPENAVDTSSIFSDIGSGLGAAWEWGTKNPALLGGVVGAGTAVANYMFAPDTAAETQADYLNKRRKEHNQGITKAATRYNKG